MFFEKNDVHAINKKDAKSKKMNASQRPLLQKISTHQGKCMRSLNYVGQLNEFFLM